MADNKSLSYLMDIDKNNKAEFSEIKSKIDNIVSDIDVKVDELSDVVDSFPSGILPPSLMSLTSNSTDDGINLKYRAYATYNPQDNLGTESDNLDRNISVLTKGIIFRYSETNYPMNRDEGTLIFKDEDLFDIDANGSRVSKEKEYTVVGLTKDKTYYISAFPYSTYGIYNESSGINLGSSYSNRTKMTWVGNKGTISVNVILPEGYSGTLGEYTITLVDQDTSSPQNIEKTATSAGVTQFGGLTGGKSYKVRLSTTSDLQAPPDSDVIEIVGGMSYSVDMTYINRYGTINVSVALNPSGLPFGSYTVTLQPQNGGETKTQQMSTLGTATFSNLENGKQYKATLSTVSGYTASQSGVITVVGNSTQSTSVAYTFNKSFHDSSWVEIQAIARSGQAATYYDIGETKSNVTVKKITGGPSSFSLSDGQYTVILTDINKESANSISVITKGLPVYVKDNMDINVTWENSNLRNYLNKNYASIVPEAAPYMKSVSHKTMYAPSSPSLYAGVTTYDILYPPNLDALSQGYSIGQYWAETNCVLAYFSSDKKCILEEGKEYVLRATKTTHFGNGEEAEGSGYCGVNVNGEANDGVVNDASDPELWPFGGTYYRPLCFVIR